MAATREACSYSVREEIAHSAIHGVGILLSIAGLIALIVVAWLLSQVVKLALSRSRELLADAGSVELTKNPDAMISALRKIENRGELPGATSAVMELCFDNPREGFADLFATHPSVDSRVKALVQYAGGRDPGPLALPDEADDEPEDQAEPQSADQLPPPVTHGPWSDAAAPAGLPQGQRQGARQGPGWGPWARRSRPPWWWALSRWPSCSD